MNLRILAWITFGVALAAAAIQLFGSSGLPAGREVASSRAEPAVDPAGSTRSVPDVTAASMTPASPPDGAAAEPPAVISPRRRDVDRWLLRFGEGAELRRRLEDPTLEGVNLHWIATRMFTERVRAAELRAVLEALPADDPRIAPLLLTFGLAGGLTAEDRVLLADRARDALGASSSTAGVTTALGAIHGLRLAGCAAELQALLGDTLRAAGSAPELRSFATLLLASTDRVADPAVLDRVRRATEDRMSPIAAAAWSLLARQDPAHVLAAVRAGDWSAIAGLSHVHAPEAAPHLARFVLDLAGTANGDETALAAATALWRCEGEGATTLVRDVLLGRTPGGTADPEEVRSTLLAALGRSGSIRAAARFLELEADPEIQADPGALGALTRAFRDAGDELVRAVATNTLASRERDAARQALRRLVQTQGVVEAGNTEAVFQLLKVATPDDLDFLAGLGFTRERADELGFASEYDRVLWRAGRL